MKTRQIFHIDANSAFLSWSAAEALKNGGTLDYRKIPAVVSHGSSLGIVLAKSIPAKKLGITTGEPLFQALAQCPHLCRVAPDYHLYLHYSRAMKELLCRFSPAVEPYSIDECFLDYTGMEGLFGPPLAAADLIRRTVAAELGFTINVGAGNNKALAKMASEFEKPDRVHSLYREELPEKLWPLPLTALFMAGRKSREKLRKLGIVTVGQLAALPPEVLQSHLGQHGLMLWNYANGRDDSPVLAGELPPPKSASQSVTLPKAVGRSQAEAIFLYMAEQLYYKLRRQDFAADTVHVTVRNRDGQIISRQHRCPQVFLFPTAVHEAAMEILAKIWPNGGCRFLGLALSRLHPLDAWENELFGRDMARDDRLAGAIAGLKDRYGPGVVRSARLLNTGVETYFRNFGEEDADHLPRFY